jgi:hypothetical protein
MIQNSKEGTPSSKKYDNKPEGERGYYYTRVLALGACPKGWSLPSKEQWMALGTYITGATESHEKGPWFDATARGGAYAVGIWDGWGAVGSYATSTAKSYVRMPNVMNNFSMHDGADPNETMQNCVRCIKN